MRGGGLRATARGRCNGSRRIHPCGGRARRLWRRCMRARAVRARGAMIRPMAASMPVVMPMAMPVAAIVATRHRARATPCDAADDVGGEQHQRDFEQMSEQPRNPFEACQEQAGEKRRHGPGEPVAPLIVVMPRTSRPAHEQAEHESERDENPVLKKDVDHVVALTSRRIRCGGSARGLRACRCRRSGARGRSPPGSSDPRQCPAPSAPSRRPARA